MRQEDRASVEPAEILRLEETLLGLQEALYERYCQTGKQMIEVANTEKQAIDQLVDEIIRVRNRMATLRLEKRCAYCDTLNEQDSIYCKRCGHPMHKEA